MMYDNHTADALTKKLVRDNQIITVSRGVDIKWYSRYIKESSKDDFYLIATGKDHRDYITLGRACEETKTKCLILTYRHKKCLEAAEIFKNSKYVNFEFIENGYSLTSYCYIVDEVSKASVMAICCDELPYGAGYTNIVECLAFKIPILQTKNPDVHLDPDKYGIGYSIKPYDVEDWKVKINLLKNVDLRFKIRSNIQKLLDDEYNSITTSNFIKKDFINLIKN